MKQRKVLLLVIVLFSLLLLACDLTAVAPTPSRDTIGALVFLDTLKSAVTEGDVVREGLNDTIAEFLTGKTTRSVLVRKARSARDWHQGALKAMELAMRNAPSEYSRVGQLYCDFLRDWADSADLLADGAENADSALLERALVKLAKANASEKAFIQELEKLYERKKKQ